MENLYQLLNNLNENKRKIFRKLEKLIYRSIEANHSITFNKNCIRERICPKGIIVKVFVNMYWGVLMLGGATYDTPT